MLLLIFSPYFADSAPSPTLIPGAPPRQGLLQCRSGGRRQVPSCPPLVPPERGHCGHSGQPSQRPLQFLPAHAAGQRFPTADLPQLLRYCGAGSGGVCRSRHAPALLPDSGT